jgi:hypothetical protein
MASRGRQTFNKRLKEQQRKERQQEKFARRMQRKTDKETHTELPVEDQPEATEVDFALTQNEAAANK